MKKARSQKVLLMKNRAQAMTATADITSTSWIMFPRLTTACNNTSALNLLYSHLSVLVSACFPETDRKKTDDAANICRVGTHLFSVMEMLKTVSAYAVE